MLAMPRWFYYLLIMAIVAPIIYLIWGRQQEMAIFICSAISLIPLAALIGRATEDLEYFVGPIACLYYVSLHACFPCAFKPSQSHTARKICATSTSSRD